jgi:hypothetical protein
MRFVFHPSVTAEKVLVDRWQAATIGGARPLALRLAPLSDRLLHEHVNTCAVTRRSRKAVEGKPTPIPSPTRYGTSPNEPTTSAALKPNGYPKRTDGNASHLSSFAIHPPIAAVSRGDGGATETNSRQGDPYRYGLSCFGLAVAVASPRANDLLLRPPCFFFTREALNRDAAGPTNSCAQCRAPARHPARASNGPILKTLSRDAERAPSKTSPTKSFERK